MQNQSIIDKAFSESANNIISAGEISVHKGFNEAWGDATIMMNGNTVKLRAFDTFYLTLLMVMQGDIVKQHDVVQAARHHNISNTHDSCVNKWLELAPHLPIANANLSLDTKRSMIGFRMSQNISAAVVKLRKTFKSNNVTKNTIKTTKAPRQFPKDYANTGTYTMSIIT